MKRYIIYFVIAFFAVSCSAGKESMQVRKEGRQQLKAAMAETTASSVESRRFVVRMDRLYANRGGMFYLAPRRNYLIIDETKAKMSLAYVGRSDDIRNISGINLTGVTEKYEVVRKSDKGRYEIKMSLKQGGNIFDVYLTVHDNGECSMSVINGRIESIRYAGDLVALK